MLLNVTDMVHKRGHLRNVVDIPLVYVHRKGIAGAPCISRLLIYI